MLPEEKQKLLDYIKTAIDGETDIETQNQISAEYQTWIAAKEPILIKKEPQSPAYLNESSDDKGTAAICLASGITMAVLSFPMMLESSIMIILGLICVAFSILMIKLGVDAIRRIKVIKEHNNNEAIAFWKRTEKIKSENAKTKKDIIKITLNGRSCARKSMKNWKRRIGNR